MLSRRIYTIALLEWFTTLAIQMIILRLTIPVTGSSVVVTSIFIGVILLALSLGYYHGGLIASRSTPDRITEILGRILAVSWVRYLLVMVPYLREALARLMSTSLPYELSLFAVAIALCFVPIYLASQTVPLLIELLPISSKGKSAGSIFFVSTIGSFAGSVLTTLVLFPYLGVFSTALAVCVLLVLLALMARHRKALWRHIFSIVLVVIFVVYIWLMHSPYRMAGLLYRHDSAYQEIIVRDVQMRNKPMRLFHTNRSYASGFDPETQTSPFPYIRHLVELSKDPAYERILLIGAAGFVYPLEVAKYDHVQRIDAVDIDPAVREIAEEYFLQQPLSPKVHFIAQSARGALQDMIRAWKKYDLIIMDAFLGQSIPPELVTREIMQDLAAVSSNGHIVRNMIIDRSLSSTFAQQFLRTIVDTYQTVYAYDANAEQWVSESTTNMMLATLAFSGYQQIIPSSWSIYTDDRNSAEIDVLAIRRE